MLDYKKQIHDYILKNKVEIVEVFKEIVRIPSVRGEITPGAPFGKACADVLEYTEKLYRENGFETEYDREGGYLLSNYGNGTKSLGLFAHADVVPVGNDWVLTKPFVPIEKDGFLIGRGVLDDKSAIIISLYCMKMLKELDIPFNSQLVCFTGANEESGMEDISSYVKKHKAPDFSLVCDTAFPLYRGDKGILHFVAKSLSSLKEIDYFSGGTAFNIILGEATAKYKNQAFTEKGISKHGALPEGSVNAGYLIAKKLLEIEDLCKEDKKQIKFVAETLEKYYGEVFGIENEDSVFGKLTCTNGIIKTIDGKLNLCFDMRYGIGVDIEDVKNKITGYFTTNGWQVEFVKQRTPFCLPEDNKYLLACLDAYKSFTDTKSISAYINAGGTYASQLPCAAEIGTALKWKMPKNLPQGHGGAHQPDECISIDGMLKALELTLLMLLECDKEDIK